MDKISDYSCCIYLILLLYFTYRIIIRISSLMKIVFNVTFIIIFFFLDQTGVNFL